MLPGKCKACPQTWKELKIESESLVIVESKGLRFICSVFYDDQLPLHSFHFDQAVRYHHGDDSVPSSQISPPPTPLPKTSLAATASSPSPKTPFSFKDFSSALSSSSSSPLSVSQSAVRLKTAIRLRSISIPWNSDIALSTPMSSSSSAAAAFQVPLASSVSLEIPRSIEMSPATKRKVHAWLVGLVVSEQAVLLSTWFGGNCLVRRVVPSQHTFVRISYETRLILELSSNIVEKEEDEENKLSFLLSRPFLPKGVLLKGPRGMGKKRAVHSFVKALRESSQQTCLQMTCSFDREREFFIVMDAVSAGRTSMAVLLLEEAEQSVKLAMIRRLCQLMDNTPTLIVFGLVHDVESAHPVSHLKRRFDTHVLFPLPSAVERESFARKMGLDAHMQAYVRDACIGYTEFDMIRLFSQPITTPLVNAASSLPFAPKLTDDSVCGQEEAKKALIMAIEWPFTKPKELARFGLQSLFRGVLLYGPAGCAKTTLVRDIAKRNAGRVNFLALSGADVYSSGFGDAEAKVRLVFRQARASSPCILFFDELDSLVGNRNNNSVSSDSVQSRVLSAFLNEMDGVDTSLNDCVVVVGATNCPDNIDSALLRPGRFDRVIFVGPPHARTVLETELTRMQVLDARALSYRLEPEASSMSGADIVGACRVAAVRALSRGCAFPQEADFVHGLRHATKSCKPESLKKFLAFQGGVAI